MTQPDAPSPTRNAFLGIWGKLAFILMGMCVAYVSHQLLEISIRYTIAAILGCLLLTVCMMTLKRLPDVLLLMMVLAIPLFTFEKSFLVKDRWVDFGTPGINIGPLDVALFPLYAIWWIEIFALRTRKLPKLHGGDIVVALFFLAHVASLLSTASISWTCFEIFRVLKYAMAYFYIAHRMERRHVMPILAALAFALLFESTLGVFQHQTGKLAGIARSKGAFTAELNTQYEVPEFEGHRRAEGTTIDSHALGVYIVVLLMFPLCFAMAPWIDNWQRWLAAVAFLGGLPGLVATFSRGAWGGFAFAVLAVLTTFYLWNVRQAIKVFLILSLLMLPAVMIGGGSLLSKRIFRAPGEIMSARWDTVLSGWEIFATAPLTGGGANAYFHAQRDIGRVYDLTNNKPAHNIAMYVLAQMGMIGMLTYILLVGYTLRQGWVLMKRPDRLGRLIGLAIFAGTIGLQADGAVDFMAFTNQVLFMQFLCAALLAAFVHGENSGQLAVGSGQNPKLLSPDHQ